MNLTKLNTKNVVKVKSIYIFLMACIIGLASASEAKNNKIEEPPWSKFDPAKKELYEKYLKCPEASVVMKLVVKWALTETTVTDDKGLYKKNYMLDNTTSAIVGYKTVKKGKDIPLIARIIVGDSIFIAAEFNYVLYIQAKMDVGVKPESIKILDATKKSTGKYFCYAN